MTLTEARNALTSRYLVEFNGQFPIAIDNIKFDIPNPSEKWIRVTVMFDDGTQSTMGKKNNRKYLKHGFLVIQVFTPLNTATDDNDTLAESSLNLFDGERLGELWLYDGKVKTIGSDGKFYQQNVIVEFKFEIVR